MTDRIWTYTVNFDTFNSTSFFKEYHYHEAFDNSKNYTFNQFSKDFGYGTRTYLYKLYIFKNSMGFSKKRKFITVHEKLSSDEMKQLSKYCDCSYHKNTGLWNDLFRDNYKENCIYPNSTHFSQNVIDRARHSMAEKQSVEHPLTINIDDTKKT